MRLYRGAKKGVKNKAVPDIHDEAVNHKNPSFSNELMECCLVEDFSGRYRSHVGWVHYINFYFLFLLCACVSAYSSTTTRHLCCAVVLPLLPHHLFPICFIKEPTTTLTNFEQILTDLSAPYIYALTIFFSGSCFVPIPSFSTRNT